MREGWELKDGWDGFHDGGMETIKYWIDRIAPRDSQGVRPDC